jgi:hypothetical protein
MSSPESLVAHQSIQYLCSLSLATYSLPPFAVPHYCCCVLPPLLLLLLLPHLLLLLRPRCQRTQPSNGQSCCRARRALLVHRAGQGMPPHGTSWQPQVCRLQGVWSPLPCPGNGSTHASCHHTSAWMDGANLGASTCFCCCCRKVAVNCDAGRMAGLAAWCIWCLPLHMALCRPWTRFIGRWVDIV